MNTLKEQYKNELVPKLKDELKVKNNLQVPRIQKIVINVGLGKGLKDSRLVEAVEDTLTRITGQKPVSTKARKSIAGFKIREGMIVGMKVTLRGKRMWDFLDKLVNVTFARVRDFRGISDKVVDQGGNLSIGFTEHIAFPEIQPDEIELLHGLQVVVSTTADSREQGLALFRALGFPFKEETK